MKVHMSVDVGYGTEVLLAVETAERSPTVCQHHRTTGILSLDWSPNYVQPELTQYTQYSTYYGGQIVMTSSSLSNTICLLFKQKIR